MPVNFIFSPKPSWISLVAAIWGGGLLLALGGCSAMPDSGPSESVVLKAEKSQSTNPLDFQILRVTPTIASILGAEVPPLISSLDSTNNPSVHNDRIGIGDVLTITIFELGSGLFSSGVSEKSTVADSEGIASITNQNLPPTEVEADGTIVLPYVGRLHAAGLTPQMLADSIRRGLNNKSQNPQVMVRISNDIANTVIVSGEVHRPGRVVLSTAQERLSDVIAIAGGANYAPEDTHVQLVRGSQTGATDLGTLESFPREDIRARPGDRIHVIYEPRTYTVFGAAGKGASEIPFKSPHVSLAEALARIGGPSDALADPNAVFLFRFEDSKASHQLGLKTPATLLGTPVVYKIDMMNPNSYFLAQQIPMKPKDILLIANAKVNKFYKFNQLIGTLISPAITAAWIAK